MNFNKIVSPYSLRNSWIQMKTTHKKKLKNSLTQIKNQWFLTASKFLLSNKTNYFQYNNLKLWKNKIKFDTKLKIRVIELALFNGIKKIIESNQKKWKLNLCLGTNEFLHQALKTVKKLKTDKTWIFNYSTDTTFKKINEKRLKNIFLGYVKEIWIWFELAKLIKANIINFNNVESENFSLNFETVSKKKQKSLLTFFLFNIYINEFDFFISTLNRNLKINKQKFINIFHYIRFKNHFLIILNGPKTFASKIYDQVSQFFKSNLHFWLKKTFFTNLNSKTINFVNFEIGLSKVNLKFISKQNKIVSIIKYWKRAIAKLTHSNARLSKAAIFSLKKNLLKSLFNVISDWEEKYNNISSISNSNLIIKKLIQKSDNATIKHWVKNFNMLFKKEMSLSLRLYHNQISNLSNSTEKPYYLKLANIKKKFLNNIKKIEKTSKLQYFNNKRKTFLLQSYKKKQQFSIKSARILANTFFDFKKIQKITLNAPMNIIIEMLIKKGFYHPKQKKPIAKISFSTLSDLKIIKQYSKIMKNLLNYYKIADNFNNIKHLIENLWKSCSYTLAFKHKKSICYVYNVYGQEIEIKSKNGKTLSLPKKKDVLNWVTNNESYSL